MVQIYSKEASTSTEPTLATVTLDVRGMKCAGCVSAVERQLTHHQGVVSACVNLITEVAVVKYVPETLQPETLAEKLTDVGFPSEVRPLGVNSLSSLKNSTQHQKEAEKQQFWGLVVAAFLLIFSGLGHLDHIGGPSIPILSYIGFHWGLATLALLIPGRPIILDGWRGLRQGTPNMNSLVGLGTVSAYIASCVALLWSHLGWECFFDEPVMLLGFILLGRTLEKRARNRASAALEALISLQPSVARLISPDTLSENSGIEIPVEQVKVGEWLKVLPGEKIPLDGEIVQGETTLNESMLTGESVPVRKQVGDSVSGGTLNLSGVIALKITRIGQDTTLAKIITSVEEAQTRKAPIQKLADIVAGYFAYGVITVALLTFLFWTFIGSEIFPQVLTLMSHHHTTAPREIMVNPLILSLKLSISVLVVSCPCALGLATPTAILVGTGIGAEQGLLIKGGDILEKVHQLDTIVFDKTGTLTLGQPQVINCIALGELTPDRLLQLAATVESGTTHPLGKAILDHAQKAALPLLEGHNFHTEAGLGVSAIIEGERVLLGNQQWLESQGISLPLDLSYPLEGAKTLVYVALRGQLEGIIILEDRLRGDAQETIQDLKKLGLEVILVTGDQPEVAHAIADKLGIAQVFAQISPTEKARIIRDLQKNKTVAMVGDGINDAPALAQADIGIALKGGTQVAMETAGIVLMREQLGDVVESIRLSLATFRKIRQNLLYALGYNTITIPIAAGVLLPHFGLLLSPAMAGGLMASSSVIVVTNSLLLRRQFSHSPFGKPFPKA